MKHFNRLFLIALTLAVGGGLRCKLQADSESGHAGNELDSDTDTMMPDFARIADAVMAKAAE